MLYAERVNSAERVAKLAGAEELAKAWTAVIRGAKDAPALLKAVPAAQRAAGYAFAEAKLLRRSKKFSEAAAGHAEGADRSRLPSSMPTHGGSSGACCRASLSTTAT